VLLPLASINVPSGRVLEVWTLPSRERGPVSVGLMDRARTLELQLKDLPRPGPNQLFEITLEPAGGSPIGRPTGPVLYKGNTAQPL
jgi:anti-sigma-K factor RskA